MSPDAAGRDARLAALRERLRVLVPFALTILPPALLLATLSWVAAGNDAAAMRHVAFEQARQGAGEARVALEEALRRAIERALRDLEDATTARPQDEAREAAVAELRVAHPFVLRAFAAEADGVAFWPAPRFPCRVPGYAPPFELPAFELPGGTAEGYRRRAELTARYEQARAADEAGRAEEALGGLEAVAASPLASPTVAARAAFRLGEALERGGRAEPAAAAFARAVAAPLPVRDERGRALRVEGALREAAARMAVGDAAGALAGLEALGAALAGGARSDDLAEHEWRQAVERARVLLGRLGAAGEAARGRLDEAVAPALEALDGLAAARAHALPEVLEAAGAGRPGEPRVGGIRHHVRHDAPPLALAWRVVARGAGARAALGIQLDLDALAATVLAPACAALPLLAEGATVEVLDADGRVRARAGAAGERPPAAPAPDPPGAGAPAAAPPGADPPGAGPPRDDDPVASASLTPLRLWTVRVRRPAGLLEGARTARLWLYGSLLALTLTAAAAGAWATIRYVERSLELARLKADFLSNITHELKTPLTAIKMYGELLALERLKSDAKRREYAEHIVRESERLKRLIEDILDFARLDAGETQYVLAEEDVADVAAEALDLFRHSARVQGFDLFVELPPVGALPPVDLDREAIVRAALNLLSNAVKYSGDRRWIKLVVRREDRDTIALAVEDKGLGIDEADLPRVFDRFFRAGDVLTRGVSGTGLGLSLVDQIVRAHGGQTRVESEKGVGSIFTLLLPVVPDYRDVWPPPGEAPASGEAPAPGAAPEAAPAADEAPTAPGAGGEADDAPRGPPPAAGGADAPTT